MKCPNCGKVPCSFGEFVQRIDQAALEFVSCRSCGSALRATGPLLRLNRATQVVLGGVAVAYVAVYVFWNDPNSLWDDLRIDLLFLAAVAVVGVPLKLIAWVLGRYTMAARDSAQSLRV
jgi:hypothetical protein